MGDCDWLLSVEKACDWLRIEPGVMGKFFLGHLVGALDRKIPPLGGILLAPRWFFMA